MFSLPSFLLLQCMREGGLTPASLNACQYVRPAEECGWFIVEYTGASDDINPIIWYEDFREEVFNGPLIDGFEVGTINLIKSITGPFVLWFIDCPSKAAAEPVLHLFRLWTKEHIIARFESRQIDVWERLMYNDLPRFRPEN